jgi:hypothetical protein
VKTAQRRFVRESPAPCSAMRMTGIWVGWGRLVRESPAPCCAMRMTGIWVGWGRGLEVRGAEKNPRQAQGCPGGGTDRALCAKGRNNEGHQSGARALQNVLWALAGWFGGWRPPAEVVGSTLKRSGSCCWARSRLGGIRALRLRLKLCIDEAPQRPQARVVAAHHPRGGSQNRDEAKDVRIHTFDP